MPAEIARRHLQVEEPAFFPVLVADGAGQLAPPRALRIDGRVQRVEADVAEAARHPDAVGRLHVARVAPVLRGVPARGVEVWIREPAQPDDARGLTEGLRQWRLRARVEPEAVLIGARRRLASRLRDGAELPEAPPVTARVDVVEEVDVS